MATEQVQEELGTSLQDRLAERERIRQAERAANLEQYYEIARRADKPNRGDLDRLEVLLGELNFDAARFQTDARHYRQAADEVAEVMRLPAVREEVEAACAVRQEAEDAFKAAEDGRNSARGMAEEVMRERRRLIEQGRKLRERLASKPELFGELGEQLEHLEL